MEESTAGLIIEWFETAFSTLGSVIGFGFMILMVAAFFRIKTKKANFATPQVGANPDELQDGELIGTEEDRLRAEEALALTDLQLREKLLETHVLVDRFQTLHGFDDRYMSELVTELRKEGIQSTYLFQEATIPGVATLVGRHGMFDFFVERDKAEQASMLIDQARQRLRPRA